jgi:VWFA-related protein
MGHLSRSNGDHELRSAHHEETKKRRNEDTKTIDCCVLRVLRGFVPSCGAKRKPWARAAVLGLSLLISLTAAAAQQVPQRAPGTLTEGVTAVLVDVVVRDRRGQPVRDLTEADFEILEDGVPQKLGSFTPVFADSPAAAPRAASPAASKPAAAAPAIGTAPPADDGPLVTALVFDRLSPQSRQLAVTAAQGYLGNKEQAPSYFGVFGIDLAVAPIAPFTRNADVLRKALIAVASGVGTSYQGGDARAEAQRRASAAADAVAASPSEPAPGGGSVGTARGDAMLAQIQANIERDFEGMERDQQGYSTTNGLFVIINALRVLPGRKSLVLFSEGIAIPAAVQRLFAGVIDAANRAHVSIYTIDAAGLRAESEQRKIGDRVNAAAGGGGGILGSGVAGDGPLTKALEVNEDVLRQDPRTGLGELATSTGGLLFDSTNDLRTAFERVDTDLRNYYLLGYTPANEQYDGKFRTIQVKVKRPGVTVAARKGYFAVRDPGGVAVNPGEAAALGALEQKPVPNAFPARAAALLFPERGRPGLVPTVVDFSTGSIAFQPSADGKSYTSDVTVLVRFVDADGQVARTVSQHYAITGPIDQMEGARRGEVVFYREPELAPGVYAMEAVVHDAFSGKSTVRFSTVEVPKPVEGALRVSTVVVVKRAEKVPEQERRPGNPLAVNDTVLYPNLGEPVSRGAKEVPFYFAVYSRPTGPAPELSIELLRNGKLVGRVPMAPGEPDASGRRQQLGRLPLEQLEPGTYDLRAVVRQGREQVVRSTILRVVE